MLKSHTHHTMLRVWGGSLKESARQTLTKPYPPTSYGGSMLHIVPKGIVTDSYLAVFVFAGHKMKTIFLLCVWHLLCQGKLSARSHCADGLRLARGAQEASAIGDGIYQRIWPNRAHESTWSGRPDHSGHVWNCESHRPSWQQWGESWCIGRSEGLPSRVAKKQCFF